MCVSMPLHKHMAHATRSGPLGFLILNNHGLGDSVLRRPASPSDIPGPSGCLSFQEVPGLSELVQRSPFRLPSVVQLRLILEKDAFRPNDRTRAWLRKVHSRLLGSQLIEDSFNVMKNSKPYQNRRAAIQQCFRTVIEEKPISTKHDFKDIAPSCAPVGRSLSIPDTAYRCRLSDMPKDFLGITSFSPKADWPSPRPEDVSLPYAEMRLMEIACDRGDFLKVGRGATDSVCVCV